MKFSELIRLLIKDYFIIFGLLIIGSVFLAPEDTINRDYILLTMTFAAIGDLPGVVLWSRSDLTEEKKHLRSFIHFVLLEVVILTYAGLIGIVSGWKDFLAFAVQILIIYIMVRFITYRKDVATANRINNKIKKLNILKNKEQIS